MRLAPVVLFLFGLATSFADAAGVDRLDSLREAAPAASRPALAQASAALRCAGLADEPRRLVVIDYTLPSTEPRLWVFDLEHDTLRWQERVAHGQGSGANFATAFSNRPGSHQTSLGLFRTADTYVGRNGYSLRLVGLEPGLNDRAHERAIVIHGAPYVSEHAVLQLGRLGRSWGCPAVREPIAHELIDEIRGGQYVYAYHEGDPALSASPLLRCVDADAATHPAP